MVKSTWFTCQRVCCAISGAREDWCGYCNRSVYALSVYHCCTGARERWRGGGTKREDRVSSEVNSDAEELIESVFITSARLGCGSHHHHHRHQSDNGSTPTSPLDRDRQPEQPITAGIATIVASSQIKTVDCGVGVRVCVLTCEAWPGL